MRYALRTDANQTAVISALEAAGATVDVIGKPLDLLVGIRGQFLLLEVKDGAKIKSAQKPTKAQERFFKRWAGYPWALVDGPDAALRAIGVLK
jgi:hypothetical protein